MTSKASQTLPALSLMLPAPGQGALAIECRSGDRHARTILLKIHDAAVALCITAERELLARLGGGCNLPLGALAEVHGRQLTLRAFIGLPDGSLKLAADGAILLKKSDGLEAFSQTRARRVRDDAEERRERNSGETAEAVAPEYVPRMHSCSSKARTRIHPCRILSTVGRSGEPQSPNGFEIGSSPRGTDEFEFSLRSNS